MTIEDAYAKWLERPDKDTMGGVISELDPLINVEVQRYSGPKSLLRNKARLYAVDAVRKYNPASGAKLSSWVVTQLQQLSRYGKQLGRPVHTSELAYRQAAEMNSVRQKLSDDLGAEPTDEQMADCMGIAPGRVKKLRAMNPGYYAESALSAGDVENPTIPGVENTGADPVLRTAVEGVHASLDERDRAIFELKTGHGGREAVDNKSIAKRLGVSEALISQRSLAISQLIGDNYGKL